MLIDGDVVLCDSTVIGEYLDDRYPTPALRPEDVADRARARWLEEYADTRMGDVFIWRIFNERVIKPAIWRQPTDEAVLQRALDDEWPDVLDLPGFRTLAPFEALTLRTPPAVLRAALAEAGAPIATDTCSIDTPRRGAMTV